MSTQTTFHLFPSLPTEIRLKIWSFGLLIPRTVSISCNREAIIRGGPYTAVSWASDTPSPALLLVNRESRCEALSIYAPYFTTLSSPCAIYLSFSQDTVKFADGVLPYIPSTALLEIQKMVLHTKDCAYFGEFNLEILKSMKKLRELEIYAEGDVVNRWNHEIRYVDLLMTDFEVEREADPGWECPMVRIFYGESWKEMRFIEGGAKIPG